jgi:thioredoxin-related protein
MQRLPDPILIPLNRYGYLTLPAIPLLIVLLLLGRDGFSLVDLGIIGAAVLLLVVFWSRTHARQSPNALENRDTLMSTIEETGKYALLAFESEFCLSSTTVGKRLMELEMAHPEKFQIYSFSILSAPGKELFKEMNGRVTPTYVLLDTKGKVVMDWPLVLPVERVVYEVKTSNSSGPA